MRISLGIFIVSALLLAGCASPPSTDSEATQSGIVGTWRWVSADGRQVKSAMHIRYYADGTLAWWPAIEAKFSTNGVTYSRYRLEGSVLDTHPDPDPGSLVFHRFKRVTFEGDTMTVVGEEGEQDVYQRVVPDLDPGT